MSIALGIGVSPVESWRTGALPLEIAFLRNFGVRDRVLTAACTEGRRLGIEPLDALIAGGGITDTLFYRSLACHLGLPFRGDRIDVDPRANPFRALREGQVALADGTILVAPTGAAVSLLLAAAIRRQTLPRPLSIATPLHFETIVMRGAGEALAKRASLALPLLEPTLSARGASDGRAGPAAAAAASLAATAALFHAAPALVAGSASVIFLCAIAFRTIVSAVGARDVPALRAPPLPDAALPLYSVLVPLYREAGMVDGLVRHLSSLDYPPAKLEILLLVEADDAETLGALAARPKPPFMRTLVLPPGAPRTKPRALNLGLARARGALITVFDAEDRPEADQLREAAACYAVAPGDVACLQAHLAITDGNLLQRLFALEYAALFDVYNIGLARLRLPLPLGGTSNHFRASVLRDVGGWDAWNVTEDADLGLRLARFGYRVDVVASTTCEEAPPRLAIWLRQRRRWTKGWMQVALVLMRDPGSIRDLGPSRAAIVGLMLVGLLVGPLATPLVLALFAWQVFAWQVSGGGFDLARGPAILAAAVPLAAIGSTLWCGWAGLRARRLGRLTVYLPLLLPYQLLIALAAWGGLWDLVRRPYHWRKTPHGAAALDPSHGAAALDPSHGAEMLSRSWRAGLPRRRKGPPRSRPG